MAAKRTLWHGPKQYEAACARAYVGGARSILQQHERNGHVGMRRSECEARRACRHKALRGVRAWGSTTRELVDGLHGQFVRLWRSYVLECVQMCSDMGHASGGCIMRK